MEFDQLFFHTGFWSEYHDGSHYSYDVVLCYGEVIWHIGWLATRGSQQGTFDLWETDYQRELPHNIKQIIETELSDFSGFVNFETIVSSKREQEMVIEMGLRMGDIDKIWLFGGKDFFNHLLDLYINPDEFQIGQIPRLPNIYILPIWGENGHISDDVNNIIQEECSVNQQVFYRIDTRGAYPPGVKRFGLLITNDIKIGKKIHQNILDLIRVFQNF